jgi:tetratricopeptide (TPR) repeat protein
MGLSILLSRSALAQEAAAAYPECDAQLADTAAAKGAFQAGTAAFNEADYDRAITYWEDAYRRDCSAHALLKNLARAYELNGMFAKGIVALETYLRRNPGTDEVATIERRIANLKSNVSEQAAADERAVEPSNAEPSNAEPSNAEPSNAEPAQAPPVTAEADTEFFSKPVLPLVVAGAGGAIAIVGSVMWGVAVSDVNAAAQLCGLPATRQRCPPEAKTNGDAAQDRVGTGVAVTIVGAAIGVGGLIWYFNQPERSDAAVFTPAVAPGFAGVAYSGRF